MNEITEMSSLLDLPSVLRMLAPLDVDRPKLRYAIGETKSKLHIVQPIRIGHYQLFTLEQVETLRNHFEAKRMRNNQ